MPLNSTPASTAQILLLFALLASPLWLYFLLFAEGSGVGLGLLYFLAITAANLVLILKVSQGQPVTRQVMVAGLLLHYLGAALYLTVSVNLYGRGVDLFGYYQGAQRIATDLSQYGVSGVKGTPVMMQSGTFFVQTLIGYLFLVTGPTLSGIMVLFTSIAFWGSFAYFRAFTQSLPLGDSSLAALTFFCFPSFCYWTSTAGKDALIFLALGLSTYSFVRALRNSNLLNIIWVILSLTLIGLIRPHIAGLVAVALALTFLFAHGNGGSRGKVLLRLMVAPLLIAGAFYAVRYAQGQLGVEDAAAAAAFTRNFADATNTGGSGFSLSPQLRLLLTPFIYFRPFPWEITSVQTAATALESLGLLLWTYRARRDLIALFKLGLREPLITYGLSAMLLVNLALSAAIQNFGLLARERTMTLPFFLIVLLASRGKAQQLAVQKASRAYYRRQPRRMAFARGL